MIRTQIYLTDKQRTEIAAISNAFGKKQSEIIREAVDLLITLKGRKRREAILSEAAGLWKDRRNLLDFKAIRSEWDRQ
jgi:hypothetical protein